MGRTLSALADEWPGATAGGHARMGGGQIPVAGPDGGRGLPEPDRNDLVERVFDGLSGER
jgi:hypothetical protein